MFAARRAAAPLPGSRLARRRVSADAIRPLIYCAGCAPIVTVSAVGGLAMLDATRGQVWWIRLLLVISAFIATGWAVNVFDHRWDLREWRRRFNPR